MPVAGPLVGDVGQGPVVGAMPLGSGAGGSFCQARFGSLLTRVSARILAARVVIWWSQART